MDEEKIFVTRSSMPDFAEYSELIKELFESHFLTNNGKFHSLLEEEIKKKIKSKNFTLFTNGHLALENAIKALNLTGEVITTPFTFVSTTHAITRNGLKPVFCDIREDNYTIDVDKIEGLITDKTSAIIPVHVYGNICDVERIDEIAKKHGLKVIYDAAHAFNETYKGKSVASFGDASMFSFHATKVFNTIEGGGLAYKDSNLTPILNSLKNFGITGEESIDLIGGNAKMNEFQAAMGLCNLKHLDSEISKRKHVYQKYISLLKDIKGIKLNEVDSDTVSNFSYFPILIKDEYGLSRDELYDLLKCHNIFSRKYFYPLTNEIDCYRDIKGDTPVALDISRRVLTLPMYADLSDDNIERICTRIREKK